MNFTRNLISFKTNLRFTIRYFNSKVKLHVNPIKCLHDEPIHISATNLTPGSSLSLVSTMKDEKGNSFLTNTHYRADEKGTLDLSHHPSLNGTYTGVFPMGPITALRPAPDTYKFQRYIKRDVTTPQIVNFKLLRGHVNDEEAMNPDTNLVLDSVNHDRIYMTEKTTRIPVREGRLRGTLFVPEGEGPFPGVIDIFGTSGGILEHRSAQLAARGFASLSLAFFAYEDLPKDMDEIDLSYFEEGVEFLLRHPKVKKNGVGAVGVSKGGDIVCSMGAFLSKVKAVVCINGIPVNTLCPLKYKDIEIPKLSFVMERAKFLAPDLISIVDMLDNSDDFPETYLPLHKSDAEFLFICAQDDGNWKTTIETEKAAARMKANGKTDYEIIKYDGAGHLLEPAYAPFTPATLHRLAKMSILFGGNAKDHNAAQADSWRRILEFLKRVLG